MGSSQPTTLKGIKVVDLTKDKKFDERTQDSFQSVDEYHAWLKKKYEDEAAEERAKDAFAGEQEDEEAEDPLDHTDDCHCHPPVGFGMGGCLFHRKEECKGHTDPRCIDLLEVKRQEEKENADTETKQDPNKVEILIYTLE